MDRRAADDPSDASARDETHAGARGGGAELDDPEYDDLMFARAPLVADADGAGAGVYGPDAEFVEDGDRRGLENIDLSQVAPAASDFRRRLSPDLVTSILVRLGKLSRCRAALACSFFADLVRLGRGMALFRVKAVRAAAGVKHTLVCTADGDFYSFGAGAKP